MAMRVRGCSALPATRCRTPHVTGLYATAARDRLGMLADRGPSTGRDRCDRQRRRVVAEPSPNFAPKYRNLTRRRRGHPSCSSRDGVVFECTLASAPTEDVLNDYTNSAQLFVDEDLNIAGGCRGQSADGLKWSCYLGQRAVDEQIPSPPTCSASTRRAPDEADRRRARCGQLT